MPKEKHGRGRRASSSEQLEQRTNALMAGIARAVDRTPFLIYSPVASYSNSQNTHFLDRRGIAVHKNPDNPDAEAIWRIGKDAYQLLEVEDQADFDRGYELFSRSVQELRLFLKEVCIAGKLIDQNDRVLTSEQLALDQRTEAEIMAMAPQFSEFNREFRGLLLAYACLREVDNALVGLDLDGRGAVSAAISAANALADAQACFNGSPDFRQVRSRMARDAALARHRSDPRQEEKRFVFACYQEWRNKPDRYKSKAAFARDLLSKCFHLESQKKIEDWVRLWDKAPQDGTMPAR